MHGLPVTPASPPASHHFRRATHEELFHFFQVLCFFDFYYLFQSREMLWMLNYNLIIALLLLL